MKTKKIAGADLRHDCFAFVGDLEKTETWKLPVFVPGNVAITQNFIKTALFRFATTKDIPDAQRAEVWRTIAGAAKAHGIPAGTQPASAAPGTAHTETVKPVDAEDLELKEARAVGLLHAERLLERLGY